MKKYGIPLMLKYFSIENNGPVAFIIEVLGAETTPHLLN